MQGGIEAIKKNLAERLKKKYKYIYLNENNHEGIVINQKKLQKLVDNKVKQNNTDADNIIKNYLFGLVKYNLIKGSIKDNNLNLKNELKKLWWFMMIF